MYLSAEIIPLFTPVSGKKAGIVAGTSAGIFGLTVLIHYMFNIPSEGPALPYLPIHILTAAKLTGLRLALIYLSLYFLLEVFHPTLFNADAEALEQSFGGTQEL